MNVHVEYVPITDTCYFSSVHSIKHNFAVHFVYLLYRVLTEIQSVLYSSDSRFSLNGNPLYYKYY